MRRTASELEETERVATLTCFAGRYHRVHQLLQSQEGVEGRGTEAHSVRLAAGCSVRLEHVDGTFEILVRKLFGSPEELDTRREH